MGEIVIAEATVLDTHGVVQAWGFWREGYFYPFGSEENARLAATPEYLGLPFAHAPAKRLDGATWPDGREVSL